MSLNSWQGSLEATKFKSGFHLTIKYIFKSASLYRKLHYNFIHHHYQTRTGYESTQGFSSNSITQEVLLGALHTRPTK